MKLITLILSITLYCNYAKADFHIEPYLGYQFGTYTGESVAETGSGDITFDVDDDQTGVAYGGKLGWGMLGFSFGVDYMKGMITSKGGGVTTDYDVSALGAYAEFTFPIMLSVSASYFFDYKMVGDSSGEDSVDTTDSGNGFKVGVGFTFLPFISLNIDYIVANIDDIELDDAKGVDIDKFKSADSTVKNIMIGISLPIDL